MKTYNYLLKILSRKNFAAAFLSLFFLSITAQAQPPYFNYVPTGGANSFPFNTLPATGKKVQWILLAGDFATPSAAPAGLITNLWVWKTTSTATVITYNTLTIKFANVPSPPYFATGAWYPGPMTTALAQNTTLTVPTTAGWVNIPLPTPFAYDPTQSLVVEISHCGFTSNSGTTGFSLPQNVGIVTPNRRRQFSRPSAL